MVRYIIILSEIAPSYHSKGLSYRVQPGLALQILMNGKVTNKLSKQREVLGGFPKCQNLTNYSLKWKELVKVVNCMFTVFSRIHATLQLC